MLFNSSLFNTRMFGPGMTIATNYSTDPVVFNMFSLSDNTNMVLTNLSYSGPTRTLLNGDTPRDHGMWFTGSYFRMNTIIASGYVIQSTAAALDAYLDTIRRNIWGNSLNLDITDKNGTVKRFIATVDNFDKMFTKRLGWHITTCPFVIEFKCMTPFGRSRSYNSSFLSSTTSPFTQSIVHSGTASAKAVFTLVFNAASSVTTININNTTTGEQINVASITAAAGDVFIFNSESQTVTKNGSQINFTGTFPTFQPGANLVTTTITGTSFTCESTFAHKTTYL